MRNCVDHAQGSAVKGFWGTISIFVTLALKVLSFQTEKTCLPVGQCITKAAEVGAQNRTNFRRLDQILENATQPPLREIFCTVVLRDLNEPNRNIASSFVGSLANDWDRLLSKGVMYILLCF